MTGRHIDPPPSPRVRPAAAAILHRTGSDGPRVYLARRDPEARFFPGYYAFVGGGLSRGDGPSEEEASYRRCVIRELVEELGVCVGTRDTPSAGALREVRARLQDRTNREYGLDEAMADLGTEPRLEALFPAGRLLTPDFVPVRYDTRYYAVECPDQEPDPAPPELAGGRWFHPGEALELWGRGEILVASPVLLVLRTLQEKGFNEGLRHWSGVDTASGDPEAYIEVRPHVRFLPLRAPALPPARTVNTAVVGADEGFVLIDPGSPEEDEARRLEELIRRHRSAWGPLRAVLLTHHHPDHAAAAGWAAERFDAPIRAHAHTRVRLDASWPWGEDLEDGERLDAGTQALTGKKVVLRAIHTPGHAPGHLAFFEEASRTLIAGDLVAGMGTILVDPPEGDMAEYLDSLRRARGLEPDVVLPGHGPFSDHPERLVGGHIEHRRMREERVTAALSDEARALDDLLGEVYDDLPEAYLPYGRRSLLAHLRKLEAEGRARETGDGGWRLA